MPVTDEISRLLNDLKADKEETRKKAVITLSRHNLPEVRDALSALANDTSTAVRYFAKKALKDFESTSAFQASTTGGLSLAQNPSPALRTEAPQVKPAVETAPTPPEKPMATSNEIFDRSGGSLTELLNDLKNPDEAVKLEVIKKLGERKEVVATEPLLGLIHNQSRSVRVYAVQSLGLIGENRVLTPLLNLLNSEQDAFVVATLVKAIARVGGVQLIPIIARYLKDPDARTRANTIEALEIIGDPKIIKFLIPLIQDENTRVKANTIKILSKFGKSNMLEKLEEMIKSDDASIRGSAIYALNAIGGEHAIDLLEKAKGDTDVSNLKKLIEGLARINMPRSFQMLEELASHPNSEVAEMAATFLTDRDASQSEPGAAQITEPAEQPRDIQKPQITTDQATVRASSQTAPPPESFAKPSETPSDRPRDYNSADFEKLWNEVLSSLSKFNKQHPNFTKEKMHSFLDFLKSTIR